MAAKWKLSDCVNSVKPAISDVICDRPSNRHHASHVCSCDQSELTAYLPVLILKISFFFQKRGTKLLQRYMLVRSGIPCNVADIKLHTVKLPYNEPSV